MQSSSGLKILYGKENGDNMADNLTDGLNELAQGFQKRFKVSNKLTIQDMIKLVTPSFAYEGVSLMNGQTSYFYSASSQKRVIGTVPKHNVDVFIKVQGTYSTGDVLYGDDIDVSLNGKYSQIVSFPKVSSKQNFSFNLAIPANSTEDLNSLEFAITDQHWITVKAINVYQKVEG